MKFGFLAHPTDPGLRNHVRIIDLFTRLSSDLQSGYRREFWGRDDAVRIANLGPIKSAAGATCDGIFYYLPLTAEEILRDRRGSYHRVLRSIGLLAAEGASLVGLGGATSIIGDRGLETVAESPVALTSGNSLTAYAALQALLRMREEMRLEHQDDWICILGYPGSIALVLARILLERGFRLNLVHRRSGRNLDGLLAALGPHVGENVRLMGNVAEAYDSSLFFIGATSTGGTVDTEKLRPGSVIIDVALPRDVSDPPRRKDIMVVDGGYVSASPDVDFGGQSSSFNPSQQINGCIAETTVLALEGRPECFSIGGDLDPFKVQEIGAIAERHGFSFGPLASFGRPIRDWQLADLRRLHRAASGRQTNTVAGWYNTIDTASAEGAEGAAESVELFRKHINPVMADFLNLNHSDRVFVKGQGATLWDAEQRDYLDFVAGYGCLNTGHNHPAVANQVKEFLASQEPVFVQYVSIPRTTPRLAQRLCSLVPGGMERVFFSNSGTEAVEAALKVARAASGRQQILYADNSYHGKTFGSLSVTGRERHRKGFGPLVGDCDAVPFGDIAALESALSERRAAAFIVEPIQGEGGVRVPPHGYLSAAREACARTGALLIVDEIQTGLGRTGSMFAIEHENVQPDIVCLAKSLSGGLIPIGATLCTAKIWDAAYGTAGTFALHTSTFGGNNLAAAIGMASLDIIEQENLPANAARIGSLLCSRLMEIASKYSFISEIRGRGLMLGIEFDYSLEGGISASVETLATRMPGDWSRLYRFLPDEMRSSLNRVLEQAEGAMEDMFCLRFVAKMAQDHRILTFMTANNNRVMRIQPPLLISEREALRFASAFEETCEDLSTCLPFREANPAPRDLSAANQAELVSPDRE